MLSYYLNGKEKTNSKNPKVVKIINGILMAVSNCLTCNNKKLRFIKE